MSEEPIESPHLQTHGSQEQQENRLRLLELFRNSPIPTEELVVNFPLYMRSSVVAKFLWINELYQRILALPGVIMEFGVWWGANLALFESLRAVYEPYNYTREVIGFDTFDGYPKPTAEDGSDSLVNPGQYAVSKDYVDHLRQLLDYHQAENVMGHIKKYDLIKGDATETIGIYLSDHPETVIALAYFDMQLYEPTKACLEAITPRLIRGSVIAMDELNSSEFPGETIAFCEAVGLNKHRMFRSQFLPDRTYVIID